LRMLQTSRRVESALEPLNSEASDYRRTNLCPMNIGAILAGSCSWENYGDESDEHRCVNKRRRGATSVCDRLSLLAFHARTGASHSPMRFLIVDEIRDSNRTP
jgi:hypothetical protein